MSKRLAKMRWGQREPTAKHSKVHSPSLKSLTPRISELEFTQEKEAYPMMALSSL